LIAEPPSQLADTSKVSAVPVLVIAIDRSWKLSSEGDRAVLVAPFAASLILKEKLGLE
jgi:hypothetical protein